jgi:HlyD family secretion protein
MLVAALGTAALIVRGAASTPDQGGPADEHTVRRGSFEISVPASGELAALNQIEIRNRLDYRAVITYVIDEGATAKTGDVLVRFASDEIENKIKDAVDAVNNANAALIASESNLEIRLNAIQSESEEADLNVMLAELDLEAWEKGEDVSKKKGLELGLRTARINYERLVDLYAESQELARQEFISQDELKRDEIAMIEAEARLRQAELDIEVYEKYERKEQRARKESDVEQAVAERDRVKKRHEAQEETARADLVSKRHQLQSRQERLADLEEQLELCTVRAPSDGLVVYAGSLEQHRWSRMNRGELQAGTELRKNELIMVLPDTSQMTAEVKVSESLSGLIEPGQRAIITSDANPDQTLEGEVIEIGVLAESGGWRDPNRRDYTVEIRLTDGNELGLKPSMRCKAEIYVGRVDDAIHVPLQAVFREGPTAYVYVPRGSGFAQHRVELGRASGLHVEVTDGLDEGEVVLLREPRTREIVARLADKRPMQGQTALGSPGAMPEPNDDARPSHAEAPAQGDARPPHAEAPAQGDARPPHAGAPTPTDARSSQGAAPTPGKGHQPPGGGRAKGRAKGSA